MALVTEQVIDQPAETDPQRSFLEAVLGRTREALAAATNQNIELMAAMDVNGRLIAQLQADNEALHARIEEMLMAAKNRSGDTEASA